MPAALRVLTIPPDTFTFGRWRAVAARCVKPRRKFDRTAHQRMGMRRMEINLSRAVG